MAVGVIVACGGLAVESPPAGNDGGSGATGVSASGGPGSGAPIGTTGTTTGTTIGTTTGTTTGTTIGTTTGTTTGTTIGTTGSSSGITMGVCSGTGTRALINTPWSAFIDDFEQPTGLLPGWYGFNDVMPTINSFQPTLVVGGAVGTAHALEYAGQGAVQPPTPGAFGVGLTYNLAIDPTHGIYCVDISAFQGVSFWAKAGPGAMTGMGMPTIWVNFVVPQTNQATSNDAGMMTGGDCQTNCYNHPRVQVGPLSPSWAHYTADFSAAKGGTATVGSVIQELVFISLDANWDFLLDEISFYRGTPPIGAVRP
jgi:hypothetical protein